MQDPLITARRARLFPVTDPQGFLGLGYMFTNHIGVQLDGVFGLSSTEYIFSDNLFVIHYTSGPLTTNIKMVQKANNTVMLMPSLILQTGTDPWNIYTRFGAVLPLSTRITQHLLISNAPGTGRVVVDDFAFEVKNSFSLGISSAAGVQYKINDRLSVWGELSVVSMSLYTKESEFKSFSEDGFTYPVSSVNLPVIIKYSKTAFVDSTGTTAPAYAQPFSNAGVNFGILIALVRKEQVIVLRVFLYIFICKSAVDDHFQVMLPHMVQHIFN